MPEYTHLLAMSDEELATMKKAADVIIGDVEMPDGPNEEEKALLDGVFWRVRALGVEQ
jgi:hypothetical protein